MPIESVGGVFVGVCLLVGALLLAGAAVWGLLGLLITREISAPEFAAYCGAFIGLMLVAVANLGGALSLGAAGAAALLAVGFPVARRMANQLALDRMDAEDITRYEHSVRKRPEIPYPYRRLAELHAKRGSYQAAAEWYERYVERVPQDEGEVHHHRKRCLELMQQAQTRPRVCAECRRVSPQEARYCVHCGAMLPGWWEVVAAFRGQAGRRYLLTLAAACLVLGIVGGTIVALPRLVSVLLLWIAAAAFMYYLYKRVTAF